MGIQSWTKYLIFGAAAAVFTTSVQADLLGTWRTDKGPEGGFADLKVHMCGQNYCATIEKAYGAAAVVPAGTLVIRKMVKRGNRYEGGEVFVTRFNRWIGLTVTEASNANVAQASACLGPVCRKQNWQRIQ